MKPILVLLFLLLSAPTFAQDAFDLQSAQIVNSPDVRGWPATASISAVSFDGATTRVAFSKYDGPDRWPDVTPPGWTGPLQYTIWLFVQVNGQWVGSGFIQMWHGRDGTGSASDPDVPSVYDKHWYYAERWSPIFGHGPIRSGELIGFMVTSGNQRDSVGPNSLSQRSNVVTFPATDRGTFTFSAPPPPTPAPSPLPVPQPTPLPLPSADMSQWFSQTAINHAAEMALLVELQTQIALARQDIAEFRAAVRSKWVAVMDSPIVKYGLAAVSGWLLKIAVKP